MEVKSAFSLCVLLLCFVGIARAQNNTYCRGTVRLTGLSGEVRSHTGPGNYQEDVTCQWIIAPTNNGKAVDSITVLFQGPFDLEYGYDFVIFYDGPSIASPELIWFTGYNVPTLSVKSSTGYLTVLFFSDQLITGKGFRFNYYANTCPSGCSNNGNCIQGACQCYGGWSGPACNISVCDDTTCISPYGSGCIIDDGEAVCDCLDGNYGRDCRLSYCSGLSHFHNDQGRVKDHRGAGDYLDNTDCTFLIQPTGFVPGDTVILTFVSFDLERGYDFLDIYDGQSTDQHRHFLGSYTGSTLPPKLISLSGSFLLKFTSDVGLTKNGFIADYRLVKCLGGCSGRGICVADNQCLCDHGYQGESCETQYCPNNCNNHGTCTNNTCDCTNGYSTADCGYCNSSIISTCYTNSCRGTVEFTTSTATFGDRSAGTLGDYAPNSACSWLIIPGSDTSGENWETIALSLQELDLQDGEAVLRVYDGDTVTSPVIAIYTGSWPSDLLPPAITSGPKMLVTFTSSSSINVRNGFNATYVALNCNNSCVNGQCSLGNQCLCEDGWVGPKCDQSECVGTCGSGQCDNDLNRCVCDYGFFGPDCTEEHCSDDALLTAPFGNFTDHGSGSVYHPNSNCGWLIQPPVPPGQPNSVFPITLVFHKIQLQEGRDFVRVYNGPSIFSPLLKTLTGSFIPDPIISSGNSLYVTFTSDSSVEYSGFEGFYSVSSECPGECNQAGYCIEKVCACFNAGGPDCLDGASEYAKQLSLDTGIKDYVPEWQWNYYYVDLQETYDALILTFLKTSNDGHPEFFIDYGKVPTLTSYLGKSIYYVPSHSLTITRSKVGRYFIGVYGREGASYDLRLSFSCGSAYCNNQGECNTAHECECDEGYFGRRCENERVCSPACENGVCGDEYKCVCNPGYTGDTCERKTPNNSRARAAIAVIVILIVVGSIVLGSFLIFRYYKKKYGNRPTETELGAMPGVPTTPTAQGSRSYKQFEDEQ